MPWKVTLRKVHYPAITIVTREKLCGDNRIRKKEKISDARAWGMVWNFTRAWGEGKICGGRRFYLDALHVGAGKFRRSLIAKNVRCITNVIHRLNNDYSIVWLVRIIQK